MQVNTGELFYWALYIWRLEHESHCTLLISMYKPDEDVWTVLMICSLVFPSPSPWHTCCVRTKLCSPSSLVFTHMQCHSLITRWKQCSAQTGFSACCSESCCFPLKYKANQMATFHHVCSEVLLLFKQIYTVLSGGNTVTVCPYSMWAGFHVSLCLKPLCLLVS